MIQWKEFWLVAGTIALIGFIIFLVFYEIHPRRELNGLLLAQASGDTERVGLLISKGADVNTRDSMGMTPLMWAAFKGRRSTVELLLKNGADVTAKSNDGYTALMLAALGQRSPMVERVLKEWKSEDVGPS